MSDWDWNSISTGEWWTAVIGFVAAVVGFGLGYYWKYRLVLRDYDYGDPIPKMNAWDPRG